MTKHRPDCDHNSPGYCGPACDCGVDHVAELDKTIAQLEQELARERLRVVPDEEQIRALESLIHISKSPVLREAAKMRNDHLL